MIERLGKETLVREERAATGILMLSHHHYTSQPAQADHSPLSSSTLRGDNSPNHRRDLAPCLRGFSLTAECRVTTLTTEGDSQGNQIPGSHRAGCLRSDLLFPLLEGTYQKDTAKTDGKQLTTYVFSRSFIMSGFIFKFLIHCEFIFLYGIREWSSFILSFFFLHVYVQFSQHHLQKRWSFLHCICLPPLSYIN